MSGMAVTERARAQLPPLGTAPPGIVSPLPGIAPIVPPVARPASVAPAEVPASDMPDADVRITEVRIEGSTVYGATAFAAITMQLVGTAIKLAAIDNGRLAILQRYRADGYALTAVTAIIAADGLLRLRVTEGRIAEVKLDGDIGPAGVQVLRFLARLTEKPAIDAATLERYLLLAGDVPGVNVRAVLRPSTDEPGALTLVAQVSRQAITGQITADNRAFLRVGPEQMLGVADFNSFSEYGEHTQIQLYRTFNGAQIFGMATADFFLGGSGLRVRLVAGAGVSTPTGSFRSIGYVGQTALLGAELTYPIIRSRQQTLNLTGTFDVVEGTITQNRQVASFDALRILRFGGEYVFSDALLGDSRGAVNAISVRVSHGLDVLGTGSVNGRTDQRNDFTKISLDASRAQTLFQPWDGASVALLGIVSGQFTRDVLPPAEKFFLGGSRLTRGFYFGQITGDKALAMTLEIQLNTSTEQNFFGTQFDIAAQFYGFFDWAETWETPKDDRGRRLRSAGLGLRLIPSPRYEIDLEAVRRITRYPTGSGAGIAPLPLHAIYWRLLARF